MQKWPILAVCWGENKQYTLPVDYKRKTSPAAYKSLRGHAQGGPYRSTVQRFDCRSIVQGVGGRALMMDSIIKSNVCARNL